MAGTAVYPILTEFVLNSETRIGVVSMIVHPPSTVIVDFISVTTEDKPLLVNATLSVDEEPFLVPSGGGGSGGGRWMRHRAEFSGQVPEEPSLITFSVSNREAPEEVVVFSGPPAPAQRFHTIYQADTHVEAARAYDRDRALPLEVRAVDVAIDGMEDHRVVGVERWSRSSIVVVHAIGDYQIPTLPVRAVARDSFERSYGMLSDGGGTHEAGATMYLRFAPALPTGIDNVVLIPPHTEAWRHPIDIAIG